MVCVVFFFFNVWREPAREKKETVWVNVALSIINQSQSSYVLSGFRAHAWLMLGGWRWDGSRLALDPIWPLEHLIHLWGSASCLRRPCTSPDAYTLISLQYYRMCLMQKKGTWYSEHASDENNDALSKSVHPDRVQPKSPAHCIGIHHLLALILFFLNTGKPLFYKRPYYVCILQIWFNHRWWMLYTISLMLHDIVINL